MRTSRFIGLLAVVRTAYMCGILTGQGKEVKDVYPHFTDAKT